MVRRMKSDRVHSGRKWQAPLSAAADLIGWFQRDRSNVNLTSVRSQAGWPDELVKKIAQNVAQPVNCYCINKCIFWAHFANVVAYAYMYFMFLGMLRCSPFRLCLVYTGFTSTMFLRACLPLFSCCIKRCPNIEYTFNHLVILVQLSP
jgi:hypothetical protein